MLMAVLSLTACGDKDDEPKDDEINYGSTGTVYTLNVVDQDGNPLKGVKVTFTNGTQYNLAESGDDGKAVSPSLEGSVNAMVISVPDGYDKPEKLENSTYHAVFEDGKTEATLVVTKQTSNKVTYTVRVLDQNDKPVEGIKVQICYNGICAAAVATDENGEIKAELDPGTVVDVKLYPLDGYTLPDPVNGEYHAVIESDRTRIDVKVTKN